MTKPIITIVIPVHDDVSGLEATLRSIASLETQVPYQVIVCDDHGPSAIADIANKYRHRHVRLHSHSGSYAARNAGVAIADTPYIAFLDADQTLSPHWIDAGLQALQHADYVGGKIVVQSDDPSDIWKSFDERTAFNVPQYINQWKFAPTANLFVRKGVIEAVGGFNERLRSGGDRVFGRKVHEAGFRQAFVPNAVTYHHARRKRAQIEKKVRTGTGMADVRVIAWEQHWMLVVLHGLYHMARIPINWILSITTNSDMAMPRECGLKFANIKARLDFIFLRAYVWRAIQLRIGR